MGRQAAAPRLVFAFFASSSTSLRATDEFGEYNVLDMFDPYNENQEAPTRSDSRHRFTVSGDWSPGAGFFISPIFRYKSKALQHHHGR